MFVCPSVCVHSYINPLPFSPSLSVPPRALCSKCSLLPPTCALYHASLPSTCLTHLFTHLSPLSPLSQHTRTISLLCACLKVWVATGRIFKNDCVEWLCQLVVELLKESPSPTLRSCWALAQVYTSHFLSEWSV